MHCPTLNLSGTRPDKVTPRLRLTRLLTATAHIQTVNPKKTRTCCSAGILSLLRKRQVTAVSLNVTAAFCLLFAASIPRIAMATSMATTSANTNGYPMVHSNLGLAVDDLAIGANGQFAQASSTMANSATVYSAGAPFPPVGTQYASATAYAYAAEGMLRAAVASASETAGIVYNAASAISSANASWSDYLTVDAGNSLLNQPGFITADINVSGMFSVGGVGETLDASEYRLYTWISGTGMVFDNICGSAYCITQRADTGHLLNGPLVDINTIPSVISLNIPVIFGREVTLDYSLDLYSLTNALTGSGGSGSSVSSVADYSHSLMWGGITGVFDSTGNRVDIFSTTSASGFDYTRAFTPTVPVPAAVWLFVSGLLGLVGVARCKTA